MLRPHVFSILWQGVFGSSGKVSAQTEINGCFGSVGVILPQIIWMAGSGHKRSLETSRQQPSQGLTCDNENHSGEQVDTDKYKSLTTNMGAARCDSWQQTKEQETDQ
jgi:hypothetical protein